MADQIKELIEKINQEGVLAAEEKARKIEAQAGEQAQSIIQKANLQAKKITEEAQDKISRLQKSSEDTLGQSARDLLLTLKNEILTTLERAMIQDISAALTPEELSRIIASIVKEYCGSKDGEVIVYLKDSDKIKLEKHFLGRLKEELKKGIELRRQDDIRSGFIISFDSGKSHFDFSDQSLAQYLGSYLKPKVAGLLKGVK